MIVAKFNVYLQQNSENHKLNKTKYFLYCNEISQT